MVERIDIYKQNSTGTSTQGVLILSQNADESPYYVLDTVDWGTVDISYSTVTYPGQYGATITNDVIGTRDIQITGWVIAPYRAKAQLRDINIGPGHYRLDAMYEDDGTGGKEAMATRKRYLNRFFTKEQPFRLIYEARDLKPSQEQLYRLCYNKYYIDFYVNSSIQYGEDLEGNNEVICEFTINGTCPYPLFTQLSSSRVTSDDPTFQTEVINNAGFYTPLYFSEAELAKANSDEARLVFGVPATVADMPEGYTQSFQVYNEGDVPVGALFTIEHTGVLEGDASTTEHVLSLAIYEDDVLRELRINYTFLDQGDKVIVNTVVGTRYVHTWDKSNREGEEEEEDMSIFDFTSDWIQLPVGQSTVYYKYGQTGESGTDNISNITVQCDFSSIFYEVQAGT